LAAVVVFLVVVVALAFPASAFLGAAVDFFGAAVGALFAAGFLVAAGLAAVLEGGFEF